MSARLLPSAGGSLRVTMLIRGCATRATSVLARRGREIVVIDTGMGHHARSLTAALVSMPVIIACATGLRTMVT